MALDEGFFDENGSDGDLSSVDFDEVFLIKELEERDGETLDGVNSASAVCTSTVFRRYWFR